MTKKLLFTILALFTALLVLAGCDEADSSGGGQASRQLESGVYFANDGYRMAINGTEVEITWPLNEQQIRIIQEQNNWALLTGVVISDANNVFVGQVSGSTIYGDSYTYVDTIPNTYSTRERGGPFSLPFSVESDGSVILFFSENSGIIFQKAG